MSDIEDSAVDEQNTPDNDETPENTQQEAPESQDTQLPDSEGGKDVDPFDEKFDHRTLPEELQPGWKQLHGSYTKRMQGVAEELEQGRMASSWIDALNDEETREAAFKQLGETLGYEVKRIGGDDSDDEEIDDDSDDLAQFRDPRVDDLLEEREQEKTAQANAEAAKELEALETKIETGIKEQAKKAKIEIDEDIEDLIFDEVAKYGPDENGEPQIEKAFKRIIGIGEKRLEQFRNSKPEAPAPPLPGGSSPTPTVQPGRRKDRLARGNQVVERSYASQ